MHNSVYYLWVDDKMSIQCILIDMYIVRKYGDLSMWNRKQRLFKIHRSVNCMGSYNTALHTRHFWSWIKPIISILGIVGTLITILYFLCSQGQCETLSHIFRYFHQDYGIIFLFMLQLLRAWNLFDEEQRLLLLFSLLRMSS